MSTIDLGKIFISHSSADKPFVRRLGRRIEKHGYSVWLDEKELKAGDALSAEIASALEASAVVIVVVSQISVKSRWLRYELNIATEKMVRGECRLIPVVIADVTLPTEVAALLYADFRNDFASGFATVASALEHEKSRRLADAPFYKKVDVVVSKVFGGIASVSTLGQYKDDDWQSVSVPRPSASDTDETDVHYVCAPAYVKPAEPITARWSEEFHDFAEKIGHSLNLVVTERPVSLDVTRPNPDIPQVSYLERYDGRSATVFVELAELSEEKWDDALCVARLVLMQFAERMSVSAVTRTMLSIKQIPPERRRPNVRQTHKTRKKIGRSK